MLLSSSHHKILLLLQVFKPMIEKKEIDEKAIAAAKANLDKILDTVESYFLGERDWMAGSDMTFADVLAVCDLMQVVSLGYNVAAGHPRLASWMKQVQERLSPHFDEVHKDILAFGGQFKMKRTTRLASFE